MIEEGKYYKTRGGYEAFVFKVDMNRGRLYPVIGFIREDGRWTHGTWTLAGTYLQDGESSRDLIIEPDVPVIRLKAGQPITVQFIVE